MRRGLHFTLLSILAILAPACDDGSDGGGGGVPGGSLQFSSASASVTEGVGLSGATITVTRTGGSTGAVGVQVWIAGGTATSGQDYPIFIDWIAAPSWADGESGPKTFTFPLLDDAAVEGDETVVLSLQFPTGGAALGSPSSTTLTILDDESAGPAGMLTFSPASQSFTEGALPILPYQVTVIRTGGSSGAVSVMVVVAGGTATEGADYLLPIPGPLAGVPLSWADGESGPKSFVLTILDDLLPEPDEIGLLTLTNVTGGAVLGSPKDAALTIIDDD